MSTNNPADDKSTVQRPTAPRIETKRFERAVTESMSVERTTDRLYTVTSERGEYDADVENGGCTCPDAEYRGDRYVCKHVVRACLVEAFANTVSTELVARVVRFAREHGCPVGGVDCAGPVGGNGRLPCPTCCDASRTVGVDEFVVWQKVVATREDRR